MWFSSTEASVLEAEKQINSIIRWALVSENNILYPFWLFASYQSMEILDRQ